MKKQNIKNTMNKKVMTNTEYYIQFTDEEIEKIGWEKNQKLSIEQNESGMILKPFAKLEIDLSEFSRETLEFLVALSVEQDISVNQVINNILEEKFLKD
jgi:hypothetical protein